LLTDLKTHSTNLEHCFTAPMTAHSITILSELKMSSFGPYAGANARSPSIALSTMHSVEGRAKCPNVEQLLNFVNS